MRVYYEDTDAGGIVYHANYLKFMERVRCDWLAEAGHSVTDLIEQEALMFVVKEVTLKYHRPARLFDELTVSVATRKSGKVKMFLDQAVWLKDELVCEASVVLGSLGTLTLKPQAMSAALQAAVTHNTA